MQMRQRDEEKRSKAWVIVMLASTIIILLLVAFFVTKVVSGNPLEGTWASESDDYQIEIDDDDITIEATIDGQYFEVDLYYTIDKTEKIITLKSNSTAYAKAADETGGKLTANDISEYVEELINSYDYSIEGDVLTLIEREYASKLKFTRVEK